MLGTDGGRNCKGALSARLGSVGRSSVRLEGVAACLNGNDERFAKYIGQALPDMGVGRPHPASLSGKERLNILFEIHRVRHGGGEIDETDGSLSRIAVAVHADACRSIEVTNQQPELRARGGFFGWKRVAWHEIPPAKFLPDNTFWKPISQSFLEQK